MIGPLTSAIMPWFVYIIQCDDDSYYTGITTDPQRRFNEHATGKKGARFFHSRKPIDLVYCETGHSRRTACKREYQIKQLSHTEKQLLIKQTPHQRHRVV